MSSTFPTRTGMSARVRAALVAGCLTATVYGGTVLAASGPWTVSNPQGLTQTAPFDGSATGLILTWDEYSDRATTGPQAYEFVVLRVNGLEVARTSDLPTGSRRADASLPVSFPVHAGDVITVVHSSALGLLDGTQNSVYVSVQITFTPTPTTTTTVPPTTSTAPPVSSVPAPPSEIPPSVSPTSVVEVGPPPTLPVVSPPRAAPAPPAGPGEPTTVFMLPDTGAPGALPVALVAAAALTAGLVARRASRRGDA